MFTSAALAVALLAQTATAKTANPFDAEYYSNPWQGTCATGKMQTPIDLPADKENLPGIPEDLVTNFQFPVIKDPVEKNVGSALQITWDPVVAFDMEDDTIFPMVAAGGSKISDSILKGSPAEYMLKMIPLQIHWHVHSEHSVGGYLPVMEAHIVTHVGPGEAPKEWGCDEVWVGGDPNLENCIAVFGIMYKTVYGAESPGYFEEMFNNFPKYAGEEKAYPQKTFSLKDLVPEGKDKSYYSYIGSLTTPPCSEGLRWHVFSTPVEVSVDTVWRLESYMANTTLIDSTERQNYRHNNRPVQYLNGRTVYHHDANAGGSYGN